ncbi:hypothetical protein PoB_006705400 [Plakobranchus ocellatus]|uniref:Uncharacterized protein n=1 Tax=Plakobranchus ocellatus TaxID=259542 RepID=A0AAV4D8N2_9GAST|nr:hypothetical protein PoB_006705400 [Plakobranchus ocellatus]
MLRPLCRSSIHPGVNISNAPSKAAVVEYRVLDRTNIVTSSTETGSKLSVPGENLASYDAALNPTFAFSNCCADQLQREDDFVTMGPLAHLIDNLRSLKLHMPKSSAEPQNRISVSKGLFKYNLTPFLGTF